MLTAITFCRGARDDLETPGPFDKPLRRPFLLQAGPRQRHANLHAEQFPLREERVIFQIKDQILSRFIHTQRLLKTGYLILTVLHAPTITTSATWQIELCGGLQPIGAGGKGAARTINSSRSPSIIGLKPPS